MINRPDTRAQRYKRHKRVRGKVSGTPECPRLNVFRSEKHIYAQVIDDVNGVTLCSASSVEKDFEGLGSNKEAAKKVGNDRGGYIYHGRVQELADGAREGGLVF